MGRKRKGRDISGWLIVDKPAGLTSTAVVNKVRWAFQAKKRATPEHWTPKRLACLPSRWARRRKPCRSSLTR